MIRFAVFGIVAAVAGVVVLPKVPREQQIRLHLGIGASNVLRATARVGHRDGQSAWDREKTWTFDHGAPSSLAWSFDLPNGEADVEVELVSKTTVAQRVARVRFEGTSSAEQSIELEPETRGLE
jgi:hypothetical protein